jgi:hypothetical protein
VKGGKGEEEQPCGRRGAGGRGDLERRPGRAGAGERPGWNTDDCRPSCAEGSWSRKKIVVTASRVRECDATGERIYTRLRIPGSSIGGQGPVLDMSHDCD